MKQDLFNNYRNLSEDQLMQLLGLVIKQEKDKRRNTILFFIIFYTTTEYIFRFQNMKEVGELICQTLVVY